MISRGLPGLRFDPSASPEPRALPRMDVVGFVGLTAAGPVDVPVPLENTGQLLAVFGDDARIGPDRKRRGHLGAAVRAFFANGGRRCFVVRANGGIATRFPLPGIVASPFSGEPPPSLVARSPGSWADGVTVATRAERVTVRIASPTLTDDSMAARLEAGLVGDDRLQPGDLLSWRADGARWFAPVEAVVGRRIRTERIVRVAGAPPSTVTAPAWFASASPPPTSGGVATVEVWTFTLYTRAEGQRVIACAGLGFHPAHPRHWRALPDDVALFTGAEGPLASEIARTRLPVAGTPGVGWEIPATMPPDELERVWLSGDALGTPWERDGLATFEPGQLLDPALGDVGVEALPALAEDLRSLRPDPRRLRGVHALWPVDEVSVVVAPDLTLPPWAVVGGPATPTVEKVPEVRGFAPCGPDALAAPRWDTLPTPAAGDPAVPLSWDATLPATARARVYRVHRASRPDFADAVEIGPTVERTLGLATDRPLTAWVRVRAEAGAEVGPWSEVLKITVPDGPRLQAHPSPTPAASAQRAVLRMCAARGDLVALLAAPEGDSAALRAHSESLRARTEPVPTALGPLLGTDRRALGHGVLYGPWLQVREGDGELRVVPPDGAMAGLVARRAAEVGAWIAPANLPLRDLVGTARPVPDADALPLVQAQAMPIRREPWGIVALGEYLLADDDADVQHLHVRRLLALLRRLATRHGEDWVFEPSSPAFARAVQGTFEAVLRELYARGAFSGDRPSRAFQVVVSTAEQDRGRLLVELRVAPVEPLRFLTVRLVVDDARGLTAEGA